MLEINFILGGVVLIAAIAFALFRWRKQAETRQTAARALLRPMAHDAAEDGAEPQTRFIESPRGKPYQLLNTSEQALYRRLLEAMPNMTVFCQIGIAQLAQLRGRQAVEEIRELIGRSVDFLVCMQDFSIVAAIELSWPTDSDPARQKADDAKRQALERLGIPLIVFRPHRLPSAEQIAREIADAIVRRRHLETKRLQREARPKVATG